MYTTTILLGPSACGKTTRVRQWSAEGLKFIHIDRDKIGTRCRNTGDSREQFEAEYAVQLESAFTRKEPDVVIDYPPEILGEWLKAAIEKSRNFNRRLIIEGIFANPLDTLPRWLERNKQIPVADPFAPETLLRSDEFRGWLATYRNMPSVFLEAVGKADEARLFHSDNDYSLKLAAAWQDRKLYLMDQDRYSIFTRLQNINVKDASVEIKVVSSSDRSQPPPYTIVMRDFYFPEPGGDAAAIDRSVIKQSCRRSPLGPPYG